MLGEIRNTVSESLEKAYVALTLTNQLPALQDATLEAGHSSYTALESVIGGLASYGSKVSSATLQGMLAANAAASATQALDAPVGNPESKKIGEYVKDIAVHSDTAALKRTEALAISELTSPEFRIIAGGLTDFRDNIRQALGIIGTPATEGIAQHLIKANAPLAMIGEDTHQGVASYSHNLGMSLRATIATVRNLRPALQQVESDYSIEDLDNRLKEAMALLKDSQNKNVRDFPECLAAAGQKITEEDLAQLEELLKDLKYGMRGVRESMEPREALQQYINQAIGDGETLLGQL
jgi:hypothetical protein